VTSGHINYLRSFFNFLTTGNDFHSLFIIVFTRPGMARGGKENVFFGQLPNKWRASGGENDVRSNNIVVTFPRPPLPPSHTPSTPTIPHTTTSVTNASSGAIGRYTIILYKTRHAHIHDISKD